MEEGRLTIAGIDPSTTETGFICLQQGPKGGLPAVVCEQRIRYSKKGEDKRPVPKFDHYEMIVDETMLYLDAWKPDVIVIEGYGLNLKNKSSIVPLIELGGILRRAILRRYNRFLAPRPSQVKEFITGKGNGPKAAIYRAVLDQYGHRCLSEDTSDAYACALLGYAHAGRLPGINGRQMEIVGSLCWE